MKTFCSKVLMMVAAVGLLPLSTAFAKRSAQAKDIVDTAVSAGSSSARGRFEGRGFNRDPERRRAVHGFRPDRQGICQVAGRHCGGPVEA